MNFFLSFSFEMLTVSNGEGNDKSGRTMLVNILFYKMIVTRWKTVLCSMESIRLFPKS